jgi:hypothetical protein
MAWETLGDKADVIIRTTRSDDLLDAMAEFLWRFRNLSNRKE